MYTNYFQLKRLETLPFLTVRRIKGTWGEIDGGKTAPLARLNFK